METFREAYLAGYISDELVESGIKKGHLRPILAEIIEKIRLPKQVSSDLPPSLVSTNLSMPAKVQMMEVEIRDLKKELAESHEKLTAVAGELNAVTTELGFAKNEISEYKEHVLDLESNVHALYRSKTWKLGRLLTKPAALLRKKVTNGRPN